MTIQPKILFLVFLLLLTGNAFADLRFDDFGQNREVTVSAVRASDGKVEIRDGFTRAIGNTPRIAIRLKPAERIFVDNLNLEFRYKFKVTSEEEAQSNFVQLEVWSDNHRSGSFMRIQGAPVNGQWYEGTAVLNASRAISNRKPVAANEWIDAIDLVARNTEGKEIALILEYLEVVQKEATIQLKGLEEAKYAQSGIYEGNVRIHFNRDASVYPRIQEQVGVKEGSAVASANYPYVAMHIEPVKKIPVTDVNSVVKVRLKLVDESNPENSSHLNSYISLRVTGEGGEAVKTGMLRRSYPRNGVWYECELFLNKSSTLAGKRDFQVGDFITQFTVIARNIEEKNLSLHVSSIEFSETEAPSWHVPSQGEEEIAELNSRLENAKPGDTVFLKKGVYANAAILFKNNGLDGKPITLKAEEPGEVILTGVSSLTVDGEYLIVDGLYFKDGFSPRRVIHYTENCRYSRLTNTAIINWNDDGNLNTDIRWVQIRGSDNTVDNCYFKNKTSFGVLLEGAGERLVFRNNYFGYFEWDTRNGRETLRILSSDDGRKQAHERYATDSVIEKNFFDRCDGELEIISVKGNVNKIRYNTFYDSFGALTLRYTIDNLVEGNLFVGGRDTDRITGIRLIGYNQTIRNNYFYKMPASSTALVSRAGSPDDADFMIYYPVKNAEVYRNSFIESHTSVVLDAFLGDDDFSQQRGEGRFSRNLFYSTSGQKPFFEESGGSNQFTFHDNLAWGKPLGLSGEPNGFTTADPRLSGHDGILYFPEDARYGADREEILKAPATPLDVFDQENWIKKRIARDAAEPFSLNNFKFEPVAEDL